MGARLIEIDSRSHQPSDSQASNQGTLPSFSDRNFREDLRNLPKDTQADNLPKLQLDEYDHRAAHPAEEQAPAQISNNHDPRNNPRRPADSLPNLELTE